MDTNYTPNEEIIPGLPLKTEGEHKVRPIELSERRRAESVLMEGAAKQKRAKDDQGITNEFLRLLNASGSTRELIRSVVSFLELRSGCDAVGVRLREGDDYPYYQTRGFPSPFLRKERSLCVRDLNGCVLRDRKGSVILECVCGAVLQRRCQFPGTGSTAWGSFWINNLSNCAEQVSNSGGCSFRGACVTAGYRSLALIPIGRKEQPLGLIQLNSFRLDHFDVEQIFLWERLADQLSISLEKFQAEQALKDARDELEWRVKERTADLESANSELMEGEAALRRAHRSLRVLQQCDEAVVRVASEPDLLKRVCEILVNNGARMAWVGFIEDDEEKLVRPVAYAGKNEGYLEQARITWGKGPLGDGPVGMSIRKKKYHVASDIANERRFAPWREEALKRGFATAISLPLVWERLCMGVLVIYSEEVNAFRDQELVLCRQLAGDLAFGISAMRNRADRERLENELLKISEREQQRIAQELHDGLCQHLAGTALMGSLLHRRLLARGDSEAQQAEEICKLLNTAVHEARNLSHGLHPVGPDADDLQNALAQLANTVSKLFHIRCSFRCVAPVLLEDEVKATHLFRIAQEAVNNAIKHGVASRVTLNLSSRHDEILLSIRDNGIGIPHPPPKSGKGLQIMNHRATAIGAKLQVRRADKQGTIVTCTVPRLSSAPL